MKEQLLYLLLIFIVGVLFSVWWNTQGIKQIALRLIKQRCEELGVQFLDDSLVLKRLRVGGLKAGRLVATRTFTYEFATDGDERYGGEIEMTGRRCDSISMDPYRL